MRGALVLVGVLWSSVAFGYDAVPVMSFAKPTADGKYVLVMLHPGDFARSQELKEKYSRSGLYPVDDPTKPVWLCDWKAEREWNVFVSDDGVYAVRVPDGEPGLRRWLLKQEKPVPPRAAGWEDAPAVFIYKDGKPFRTLALRDVFDSRPFTDRDCFMGPVVTIDTFRDADGRISVSSEADGRKQTVPVAFRTGEVVDRGVVGAAGAPAGGEPAAAGSATPEGRSWSRFILIGLVVVGVCSALFAGIAVLVVRFQRARQEG
jgi:hypothetical protein